MPKPWDCYEDKMKTSMWSRALGPQEANNKYKLLLSALSSAYLLVLIYIKEE